MLIALGRGDWTALPLRMSSLTCSVAAGHRVLACLDYHAELRAEVMRLAPDAVIIDIDAPNRDLLEDMHALNQEYPRPIVLFTQDDNPK